MAVESPAYNWAVGKLPVSRNVHVWLVDVVLQEIKVESRFATTNSCCMASAKAVASQNHNGDQVKGHWVGRIVGSLAVQSNPGPVSWVP